MEEEEEAEEEDERDKFDSVEAVESTLRLLVPVERRLDLPPDDTVVVEEEDEDEGGEMLLAPVGDVIVWAGAATLLRFSCENSTRLVGREARRDEGTRVRKVGGTCCWDESAFTEIVEEEPRPATEIIMEEEELLGSGLTSLLLALEIDDANRGTGGLEAGVLSLWCNCDFTRSNSSCKSAVRSVDLLRSGIRFRLLLLPGAPVPEEEEEEATGAVLEKPEPEVGGDPVIIEVMFPVLRSIDLCFLLRGGKLNVTVRVLSVEGEGGCELGFAIKPSTFRVPLSVPLELLRELCCFMALGGLDPFALLLLLAIVLALSNAWRSISLDFNFTSYTV